MGVGANMEASEGVVCEAPVVSVSAGISSSPSNVVEAKRLVCIEVPDIVLELPCAGLNGVENVATTMLANTFKDMWISFERSRRSLPNLARIRGERAKNAARRDGANSPLRGVTIVRAQPA
jgi:hypothetical protein